MKVLLGRQETDLSNVMLVGLSLILIVPPGTRVDSVDCGLSNFQCQSGNCIPKIFQCNHEDDCPDGSDEIGCATVDDSMALLWTSKDSTSKLGTLGLLYGDLDVCLDELQRGQTFNTSYYRTGYKRVYLTSTFDSLEVDYVTSYVIYFDQAFKSITVAPYFIGRTGFDSYSLYSPPVSSQVTGVSFDWVSKLLYWSDAGSQHIAVMDASAFSGWWRPVVDTNLTSPQDIVVHPNQSYLFWIDLDIDPKIERFDLVNEIREVLVSNDTILRPTKLAIDFESERLYWLDSDKETIGSCNFDGSDASLWQLGLFSQISAFTFYRQYLFLGDLTRSLIHAFNASKHQVLSDFELYSSQQGIIDFATYDQSKQMPLKSPCTVSKGGCSHFCIRINATARKCQCAMGFFLDLDGRSCVTRPFQDQFLLVTDTRAHQLFQVGIATGEVRATIDVEYFLPTAADYDHVSKNVFWFDSYNKTIRRTNLNSGTTEIFVNSLASEVTSLAVDPVGRNLYYTCYFAGTIGVISLTTVDIRTILAEPGSRPRVVVLDIESRSLYWSDCGKRSIEKAQMSNASVHQSVVSELDFCVSAIAIDFLNEVIYWGDQGGHIESSKLDGSAKQLIYSNSSANYTGMTIDDAYLYIADNSMRQLLKLDRAANKIGSLTGYLFVRPYALTRYTSSVTTKSTKYSSATSTTTTTTLTATVTNSTAEWLTTSKGGPSTTTIILASVICGSVVLIAAIVVVGIVVAKWIKSRRAKTPPEPDPYDNIIPSPYDLPEYYANPANEDYTELDQYQSHDYDFEIDDQVQSSDMNKVEELKETRPTDSIRQSAIDNDYIRADN